jgi:hypothetical protein
LLLKILSKGLFWVFYHPTSRIQLVENTPYLVNYLVEMSPRRSGLVGSPVGSSRLECSPLFEELFSIFSSVSDTATLMSLSVTVLLAATEEDSSVEASFEGSGVAGAAS